MVPAGPDRTVFVVVSGCLTLRVTQIDSTRRTVGFRLPGELVGLESWARGENPYEIEAATASVVCRLTLPRVHQGRGNGALLERLLVKSAEQIDRALRPWSSVAATERVAAFVEDFVQRAQVKGSANESVRLPMTRGEIGSYLGLAEETVVRALARLKRGRRLDVRGKTVTLCRSDADSWAPP
jgi:CRP/FNR family transcriptional regulator, anaerobic regulatory protein